jgi:hypothetical protein
MAFTAGAMTASYNGMSVGQIKDLVIEHVPRKRLITGDAQGSSPQDAVYQGMECFIEFTLVEWDGTAAQAAFWPYSGTYGTQGQVGRTDDGSSIAKALLLEDIAGTTAENDPDTLTASKAILAEGFPVETLFAPDLREVPLRFRLYPVSDEFFALT